MWFCKKCVCLVSDDEAIENMTGFRFHGPVTTGDEPIMHLVRLATEADRATIAAQAHQSQRSAMSLQQMIQAASAAIIAAGDALTNRDEPTARNQLQSAICYISFAEMELADYPAEAARQAERARRAAHDERIRANREHSITHNHTLLERDADFRDWQTRSGLTFEEWSGCMVKE